MSLTKIRLVSADGLEAIHYTPTETAKPVYYRLCVQRPNAMILGRCGTDETQPKREYRYYETLFDGERVYYEVFMQKPVEGGGE